MSQPADSNPSRAPHAASRPHPRLLRQARRLLFGEHLVTHAVLDRLQLDLETHLETENEIDLLVFLLAGIAIATDDAVSVIAIAASMVLNNLSTGRSISSIVYAVALERSRLVQHHRLTYLAIRSSLIYLATGLVFCTLMALALRLFGVSLEDNRIEPSFTQPSVYIFLLAFAGGVAEGLSRMHPSHEMQQAMIGAALATGVPLAIASLGFALGYGLLPNAMGALVVVTMNVIGIWLGVLFTNWRYRLHTVLRVMYDAQQQTGQGDGQAG